MRPYTMHEVIVLLLCALASADATAPCDQSLINGVLPTAYTFNTYAKFANSKELKCSDDMKQIVVGTNPKAYPVLICDPNDNAQNKWKDIGNRFIVPNKQIDQQIDIACTVAEGCDQFLIKGFNNDKMTYASSTLNCKKPFEVFQYTDGNSREDSHKLTCVPAGNWNKEDGTPTGVAATAKITVTDCKINPCDEKLITMDPQAIYQPSPSIKLSCLNGKQLKIATNFYDALTCTVGTGWADSSGDTIKRAIEKFAVTCEDPPTTPCSHNLPAAFHAPTKTLKCTNDLQMIKLRTEFYASLVCSGGKWKDPSGTLNEPASTPLSVTCETPPACTVLPVAGMKYDTATNTLSCEKSIGGPRKAIMIGSKPYVSLTCDSVNGWKDGEDKIAEASSPLSIACEEYCAVQHKCVSPPANAATCIGGLEDGLTDEAEEKPDGEFKCKKNTDPTLSILEQSDKNGIKLNDNFANSNVKCDAKNGWTDIAGKQLADPLTKVTIECVKVKCSHYGAISCAKLTVVPPGYYCESSRERSPFEQTDDPNLLNCGLQPMKRLYDKTTNEFYNSLRCKTGSEYYTNVNTEDTTIKVKDTICLQLRCNTCNKLPGVTGAESEFTRGTPEDCAKAECTSNLWKIKKTASTSTEEEYAGEVVCTTLVTPGSSSTDDPTHSPMWQIDGTTAIVEGSCIPAGTPVKCTEAAKLETACTAAWKSASGCKELGPLDDANEFECPTGKMMFYMKRGSENFEEGGDKIKCDPTKGKWTVIATGKTIDDYERGGTVICADANPSPATTTQLPPTTTPFVEACTACPPFKTNDKPNDVKRENSDNETCIITVKKGAAIKIQKGELIGEDDELRCTKTDLKWKKLDGTEVGEISVVTAAQKNEEEGQMMWIIGGVIGGVVVLFVVFIVIFKVCVFKKKPDDKDEETKRKMLEEGRKKKKRAGDNNDEILDDVAVENPSEIKL